MPQQSMPYRKPVRQFIELQKIIVGAISKTGNMKVSDMSVGTIKVLLELFEDEFEAYVKEELKTEQIILQ
jgi:hypothetical protein